MARKRRSMYHQKVEPNLELIKELLLSEVSIREICERLDVKSTSWYEYINRHPEFAKLIKECTDTENKLSYETANNSTFSLTVIVQEDPSGIDEDDEWILTIRKYEYELQRMVT